MNLSNFNTMCCNQTTENIQYAKSKCQTTFLKLSKEVTSGHVTPQLFVYVCLNFIANNYIYPNIII